MDIIDPSAGRKALRHLDHGVLLNKTIVRFFTAMEQLLSRSTFEEKGIKTTLPYDKNAIEIETPHNKVIGVAEHVYSDGDLAARLSFSTVHTRADGEKSSTEIMTVVLVLTGNAYVIAVDDIELTRPFDDDDGVMSEIALRLFSNLQSKLPVLTLTRAL
ncbi:hypothetical protein [Burkholderia sp. IMCC1007]|uniref:hypothetical protein n=1 Tax=Burkholderia sp. IMCC1007 TaxID=3004104 RepID=UPI0022B2E91E|nr:hypothetical protein [Burkholderia sp. IMCC1007]